MRSLICLVLGLLAAVATGGCGGGTTTVVSVTTKTVTVTAPAPPVVILNTEKVERKIEEAIQQQRGLSANVSCPSGVHQQQGITFTCKASLEQGLAPFRVTETDDQGDVTFLGVR